MADPMDEAEDQLGCTQPDEQTEKIPGDPLPLCPGDTVENQRQIAKVATGMGAAEETTNTNSIRG